MDTPVYVESMIVGGIVLLLYVLLYIRFVPRAFEFVMGVDQDEKLTTVQRTSTVGARELLRLILMLAIGRGLFMLGAFLWSLYLNGYTETAFEIQHIWADHMFAERIISIANKGYAAETVNQAGKYYNLLFPPLYSWIVRLTSPVYLSSIRAGFFLSNLNAILSGIVLYLLVMYDHDRRSAVRALWYYSILPPSFLLTCTIPASTFLLFSLICVYCARRKLFMISSLFGAMAALTDRLGIVLVIPLLIEFFNSMTKEYRSLKSHVQLHADGAKEHHEGSQCEHRRRRMGDQAFDGTFGKLEAHEQDQKGDDQGGQVFRPAVAEGMLRVGLLAREDEAAQGDQGGTHVAQIVEAVRLDGQGADQHAQYDLEAAQYQVEEDAYSAADHAVAVANSFLILPST